MRSDKERHQMELLINQGCSFRQVANILKRSPSTISRECKRGRTWKNKYLSEMTIREKNQIKLKKRRKRKADNPLINEYVEKGLKKKYSPAIISSQIYKYIGCTLGKDAIYDWAYRGNPSLHKYLTRKHKRIDIDLRPKEATERLEFLSIFLKKKNEVAPLGAK
jgi:IS30 family transposase